MMGFIDQSAIGLRPLSRPPGGRPLGDVRTSDTTVTPTPRSRRSSALPSPNSQHTDLERHDELCGQFQAGPGRSMSTAGLSPHGRLSVLGLSARRMGRKRADQFRDSHAWPRPTRRVFSERLHGTPRQPRRTTPGPGPRASKRGIFSATGPALKTGGSHRGQHIRPGRARACPEDHEPTDMNTPGLQRPTPPTRGTSPW